MAKYVLRARYDREPQHGLIRPRRLQNGAPAVYSLQLFHIKRGLIQTKKQEFGTVDEAIAYATLYDFSPAYWKLTESTN